MDAVTLHIAAASDLRPILDRLTLEYVRLHPDVIIRWTFGASGTLSHQVLEGAPFDLFLSADRALAEKIAIEQTGTTDDVFDYCQGELVLWVGKDVELTPELTRNLPELLSHSTGKIAIANPEHAPYGKAAEHVLRYYQLDQDLKPRIVIGENVSQAAAYVETGAASMGFVSKSLSMWDRYSSSGIAIEIPSECYPPMIQSGVISTRTKHLDEARSLQKFLLSQTAQQMLYQHGYIPNSKSHGR